MGAPSITITVEPMESGAVVYAPLAPPTAGGGANGQLSLKIWVKNNGASQVHTNQLKVSFVGSPAVGPSTFPLDLTIAAGATASWFVATAQNILLPVPAPGQIRLAVSCDGFDTPVNLLASLKAHQSPTPAGSYRFPARAKDLRQGEYWSGASNGHAPAGDGSQLFGYDMGVIAWDAVDRKWTDLLPGTSGTKNEHFRISGKPIYAMAAGAVVAFANDRPNNPNPGVDLSPPDPVEGNHFYLQHGDELVLYAHFQKGSLNASLTSIGATVEAGQFLGLAGNSGNSSAPHLHVHSIQATSPWKGPLRPLPFNGLHVIDRTAVNPPDPAGPWTNADDKALPSVASVIWPEPTAPTWYPPGRAEMARHGIPEHRYQTEFERIAKSGYRPVWVDGYDVNGDTFFNVIFRPNDGTAWAARHGLSGAGYQSAFTTFTGQGFRPTHVESYLSRGAIRYAAIFVKSAGPAFAAYHGRTADDHQNQFNTLTAGGFRPVNISAVSIGGQRTYAGLYEKRDVGSFFVKSFLTPGEYQAHFEQNTAAGRRLVYLAGYTHSAAPRLSAIWQQKPPAAVVARHGLTSAQYQSEFDAQLAAGFLTRVVTGYEEGNGHRFGALWTK